MFYISPWMFLGLILGTAYFVLVLLGYGGNRDAKKTRKKSEGKLVSSTETAKDFARQKKLQITDEKPGTVEWQKESQRHKLEAKKQIGEVTFSSRQTSDATKSFVGLKLAPAGSEKEEKLIAEQSIESVGVEDVLQSLDALYLREFSVPEDFIIERQRIRTSSHDSENFAEISTESIEKVNGSGLLEGKDAEVSENITPTLCSSVSSVPYEQRFDDIAVPDNEQPTLLSDVMGTNSSTDLKQAILFGDLADLLVTRAKTGAFHHIDLESKANYLAEKMSTQIVCDALGQFATGSVSGDQDLESPDHVQELHSFAENVVDSLIEDAFGKVSVVEDAESFAKDLSEQVVHEGMEHYAVMEKLKQGKKQKVSLQEMKLFSEGIISEVVSDGIDEAVVQDINTSECINSEDKNFPEERSPENEDNFAQQTALSSSLQPHITGVVENLVNGAIYEAALRVKAQGTEPRSEDSSLDVRAQEILESQVVETVKEVIGSALHEAADFEEEKGELEDEASQTNKSKLESRLESFVDDALDAAVSEAAGKVLDEKSVSDKEQKLLNGHVDLSLESPPEEVVSSDRTNRSQGVVEVPLKEKEEKVELRDKGTGESSDYWRQSLILDLQGDEEEFDESFESERSQPSTADSPITPVHKETVSDEDDSEEFIDSSEDEVIDHAEDAKLGAVGGSNVKTYESDDDDDDKMAFGDELDDGIDNDDDDDNEDEADDLLFVGQTMVDGLCVSKPKEKRKKKKKSLPRPRIQSEPEGYVLSTNENILGGYVLSTNENIGGYVPSANENVGDYVFSANENIDSMYAGSHYNTAVVIDNGSGVIKLGLAGEKIPTVVQPALFGIPKRYSLQMAGMDNKKDRMYGDSATMRAGVMQLDYPMSSGFLENWSDVEDIWEYMLYEELGIEEGNHPVLVTEVANTPKKNREKMAEILFEHLGVPAMYLANQLVLSLYASGLTVGVCLSSGFSVTQAAAIYEGHILAYTVQELDIGGKSLTDNLQKLLRENKGHNFNSSSGWQIVNNMKERKAYVAKDYSSELIHFKTSDALTQYYSLPDGQAVEISSEMISTPEPLFNPETLLGADDTIASQEPIHKLVNNAFRRCSPELQDNIYRNIVLSGGTTLMKGLVPRLEYELGKINPRLRSVRVPDNRMYSAWIGGSILGSLSTLDSMYATIDEYADYGGRIVNQKCF